MISFRKISAASKGKLIRAYLSKGTALDDAGRKLATYYIGRDPRASWRPDMAPAVAQDGTCWDLVYSEYIEVAGRRGAYICKACPPDARAIYASREALWRDHLFELFLSWVNSILAPASVLALYRSGGVSWAKLLRDGEVPGERLPDVAIPLRTAPERL